MMECSSHSCQWWLLKSWGTDKHWRKSILYLFPVKEGERESIYRREEGERKKKREGDISDLSYSFLGLNNCHVVYVHWTYSWRDHRRDPVKPSHFSSEETESTRLVAVTNWLTVSGWAQSITILPLCGSIFICFNMLHCFRLIAPSLA